MNSAETIEYLLPREHANFSEVSPELRAKLTFDQTGYFDCVSDNIGTVPFLRNTISAGSSHLDALYRKGFPIRQLVFARAYLIDQILRAIWTQCGLYAEPKLALLAVGGYGRGELLPHSDIDLLVLLSDDLPIQDIGPRLEQFVTLLWDLKLDIGHSVRTISESIQQAQGDITIATNLLETRTLAGNEALRLELSRTAYSDASWSNQDFFRAKRDEQMERHRKYGDTEYNLEPNVKTSPGTLRDIQTIGWITKRHFGFQDENQEAGYEFLTDDEVTSLREGETFLWQVRYGLQMITRRSENRILFDHQPALAELFGYHDTENRLGVEQMMQKYYRNALALRELNDVVLQHYDEVILHADGQLPPILLNRRFQVRNNYIEAINNQVFAFQTFALIEVFLLMAQHPYIVGIRASTIRSIRAHRHLIDENFRNDITNTSLFMELLKTPHALHRTLSAMKRYGVLENYLPEFGQIIGQMQYDLFHVHTVDTHILRVVRNMVNLQDPEKSLDCPLASRLAHRLPKLELLYIAGIFHDIGKGQGGDHSDIGSLDVERFGKRHHLSQRDTSLLSWLVKNHLLMSMTAQRKDIADPEVIHEFADHIDTQVHLDYLYTLTVCDISATNPKLWNNWRAALLRQLYNETKRVIRRGLEAAPDRKRWIAETQLEAKDILHVMGFGDHEIDLLWKTLDDDYFLQASTREIARQTALILRHKSPDPLIQVRKARDGEAEGFLQITIYQYSRPGQFAVTTATLEQLHLNIHEARVSSSSDTHTLSNYVVSSAEPSAPIEASNEEIEAELSKQLENLDNPGIIKRRTPRQLQHFSFPTEVAISHDMATNRTVLELITPDRPGLLARIASVFLEHKVGLVKARIATLGERVEDVFVITNYKGKPINDPEDCRQLRDSLCNMLDAQNAA